MRRKSERTASKKVKASPEKKEKEKSKRKSTRRRKQSSSSENESAEESTPIQAAEVSEVKSNPPATVAKEDSPEESQDQVWQVKAAGSSGDVGEIQKLKICLTRPPSTPERVDRSPRSKRKHSRATSSSDTPSTEGDEKKKSKHRSRRTTETKEDQEKNQDSQEEQEVEMETQTVKQPSGVSTEASAEGQTKEATTDEAPVSTTNEENKSETTSSMDTEETQTQNKESSNENKDTTETVEEKCSDADTTVASPKNESTCDKQEEERPSEETSPQRERSLSGDQSEVLELQADESLRVSSEFNLNESQDVKIKDGSSQECFTSEGSSEVSKSENKTDISEKSNQESDISTNVTDVVECTQSTEIENKKCVSEDLNKEEIVDNSVQVTDDNNKKEIVQPEKEVQNGQTAPIVVNRKRRWGSRPSKLTTQKSITISTDVLKEIIPDVKPVEFEEVVEEKKHKRVEVPEKVDRPVLPKIVIDNTDTVKKEPKSEEKDKENVKNRDIQLSATRKISIVKESDSITVRPPSPPRHKQSNILFITNLVRPFTLLQLKNLLQRTGRIVEDGFWIDRIKSKCYVKYEIEDQAVETRHALHGVRWPVSNPKTLHVDFSTQEDFDKAKVSESTDNAPVSTIPGTVEDWLREQDMKREKGEMEKPWERKAMREWDVGKNDKDKEANRQPDKFHKDERLHDKRRHRSPERSPEPARKFKKKEEEAPAKLLDDLFRKTKTTPCIYWLPLSAETIAVKEEQRRQHMADHERRLQELRRTHRRH